MYRAVFAVWQLLEIWTSTTASKHMLSLQSCLYWTGSARKNQNALFAKKLKTIVFYNIFDFKTKKDQPGAPGGRWGCEIQKKF